MATKTEDGVEFGASDYCYVPDESSPSTWKLRISSTPGGGPDPAIVGAAAAALGPGFRGQRVDIPSEDRAAAVACVRRAWHKAHPDTPDDEMPMGIRAEDDEAPALDVVQSLEVPEADVEVRDAAKREIDVRLVPWDQEIETLQGREVFRRGAFDEVNPDDVLLMGLEHEAHIGLGQDGRPVLTRRPVGKAIAIDPAAPRATFRVAKTAAGDELLALAADRIVRGVSVEFTEVPGGTVVERSNGRRLRAHQRVRLRGASLTYRPAYGEQAAVLAVRSSQQKEAVVAEAREAPASGAEFDPSVFTEALNRFGEQIEARSAATEALLAKFADRDERMGERLEKVEEQARMQISIPTGAEVEQEKKPSKGEWLKTVTRILSGDRVPDVQMRALADVITTDNAGVVPPAYLTEIIGVIDPSRPFLQTTRRLPTPDSGMKLTVPKITQRPTAGVQATEKTEVSSQKTIITSVDFDAVTIAGAGDLSLQVIKRSSPQFLDLWLELLGEAYAIEAEDQAITALLNEMGGVGGASALDPNDLALGDAFVTSFDAIKRPPDTIWLSTAAVGAFIDAKASTTNQPLYPGLSASATAAGGITGVISGLRPVHVPTLDAHGAYAIVGPSSGFAWAEDGTYTLQVDVPATAGRDVALVGILWPAPWYPDAFTAYNVAS